MKKTVLNLKNVDVASQPMFFGEQLGLQRFDVVKYPQFEKSWQDQKGNLWSPEEVDMTCDLSSYEDLTEVEKFIFESNLKFQTAGDSLLSRSIDSIKKHVSNTELEYAMNFWMLVENIHSQSYTHVLRGILKDPTPFFDSILEDTELVDRMKSIILPFDAMLSDKDEDCEKTKLFKAILALQIAEGVLFYTSFACSFFFAKNGKMTGNGKIITLIKRDESTHQSLTQNIIKRWKEDESEGFKEIVDKHEEFIYEAYRVAVEGERKWAEYLFSKGEMVGLTKNSLCGYVEWNANNRLRGLGYKKIFAQQDNPLTCSMNSWTQVGFK